MGALRVAARVPLRGNVWSGSRVTTSASVTKNLEERGDDRLPSYTWHGYMAVLLKESFRALLISVYKHVVSRCVCMFVKRTVRDNNYHGHWP